MADLKASVLWANSNHRRWAVSNRNAGTIYADFFTDLADLRRIDWTAVNALDFRGSIVKDGKQAEFLLESSFPCSLIEEIGVVNLAVARRVEQVLGDSPWRPPVHVRRSWYF